MTQEFNEQLPAIESWDSYWQGAETKGAYTGGGSEHPLVLEFWAEYFRAVQDRLPEPRIIDIASGNGALVEHVQSAYGGVPSGLTCLDISESAIKILEERFPGIRGVVADAGDIQLPSQSFDIVASQFGVEYAGLSAVKSLHALLAAGGELALLMHIRDGVIFHQCTSNLEAANAMQEAEFIEKCSEMFETGFALMAGGDAKPYQAAGKALAPAIKAMEDIMQKYGPGVASGSVLQIYRDVRTIHKRMSRYDRGEVLEWLRKMGQEMEAYKGRMDSMRQAALDEDEYGELVDEFRDRNFSIVRSEPLKRSASEAPVAWVLIARKE